MRVINLDGSIRSLKPCHKCGSTDGELHPPKGPHGNMVKCAACGSFLSWLPKKHRMSSVLPDREFQLIDDRDS